MGRIILLMLTLAGLAGCVTEQTFIDSKKQVRNLEFDKKDAAKTRLILGLSYLENNRFEQAKYNLEKALEFGPHRADVNYSLGYYYQSVGEMEQAEQYYLKAIDLEPKNPDTHNNYGTFLCKLGDVDKAEIYFKKAIDISKYTRAAESYENLAICALANEQFIKADQYFGMSYKHNPSRPNNVLSLAGIKYIKGDLVAALDFYSRYIRLGRVSSRGLLLGYILESRRGRLSQANEYLNKLKEEHPDSRETLYATMGEIEKSEFESMRTKFLENEQAGSAPAPKIKIIKKAPTSTVANNTSAQSNTNISPALTLSPSAAAIVSGAATGVVAANTVTKPLQTASQVNAELKRKVQMFSAPLTDTEAVKLPEETQAMIAISKEAPLPEETMLVQEVQTVQVVNDRASTERQKRYLVLEDIDLDVPMYEVQPGDNLYRISVSFNVQIASLLAWNSLTNEELSAGQKLYVSNPVTHVEVTDEILLSALAEQQKTKLSALMKWNKVDHDGWVKQGSKVVVVAPEGYIGLAERIEQVKADSQNEDKFIEVIAPEVKVRSHKVQKGEFLYKISREYNIKINALIKWNKLKSESDIKVGQRLYVMNPDVYYIVKYQQKLSDVAKELKIELSQLMEWNNAQQDGLLKTGTKLLKVNAEQYQ